MEHLAPKRGGPRGCLSYRGRRRKRRTDCADSIGFYSLSTHTHTHTYTNADTHPLTHMLRKAVLRLGKEGAGEKRGEHGTFCK